MIGRCFGLVLVVLCAGAVPACDGGAGDDTGDDTADTGGDTDSGDTDSGDTDSGDTDSGDTGTDACTNGDLRPGSTACGLNGAGVLQQQCGGGQWADTTTCLDDDVCTNAAIEVLDTCGVFDDGDWARACADGQWAAPACDDPASLARIADLRPGAEAWEARAHWAAPVGGALLYTADLQGVGMELWRTDGTAAGTSLVEDLLPGQGGGVAYDRDPVVMGGALYFVATDGSGNGLWRSDGTAAGTTRVFANPETRRWDALGTLAATDDGVFFSAPDGVSEFAVPWFTDGTTATALTTDAGGAFEAVAFGGKVYFVAAEDQGWGDWRLWRTDGTAPGTEVMPVPSGDAPIPLVPYNFHAGATKLWFTADADDGHDDELWVTDGTPAGTVPVHPQGLPAPWSYERGAVVGGTFVFAAEPVDGSDGAEPWTSDGTAAGTTVFDLYSGSDGSWPWGFTAVGDAVYFAADDGTGARVHRWSAPGGVGQIDEVTGAYGDPDDLYEAGGVLYFAAEDGGGVELWKATGTTAARVADIEAGDGSSEPTPLGDLGGTLVLSAWTDAQGSALYTSTGAGATFVARLARRGLGSEPVDAVALGDRFVFVAHGADGTEFLYAADGTPGSAVWLKEFDPAGPIHGFGVLGAHAYFEVGHELWRTDGTPAGTTLVKVLGYTQGEPVQWAQAGGTLYFRYDETPYAPGRHLWQTDGTAAGTFRVQRKDGATGPYPPINHVADLTPHDGSLYFHAWRPDEFATGLYVTSGDGVADSNFVCSAGPSRITSGVGGVYFQRGDTKIGLVSGLTCTTLNDTGTWPSGFATVNGRTVFAASEATHGGELWVSQGTPETTGLLLDIVEGGEYSSPDWFTVAGDRAFFLVQAPAEGTDVWVTGGTTLNTARAAADQKPGSDSWQPDHLLAWGDDLVFVADDGTHGRELWISGGTPETTRMIADVNPGRADSSPDQLVVFRDRLLFSAESAVGRELWITDGTAEGTKLVLDASPGPWPSNPEHPVAGPHAVFLRMTDLDGGIEPWALTYAE